MLSAEDTAQHSALKTHLKGVSMAAKENRIVITMACTVAECRSRNYVTSKNRIKHQNRMELNKYCPVCRKHTLHREAK